MTLDDIISRISQKHPEMVYIGKDYSVADLIRDLREYDDIRDWDLADAVAEAQGKA